MKAGMMSNIAKLALFNYFYSKTQTDFKSSIYEEAVFDDERRTNEQNGQLFPLTKLILVFRPF